jgi:hypothetical protein
LVDLENDDFVRRQLELWIPNMSLSELENLYKGKFYMKPLSDDLHDFQEHLFIKYKGTTMTFWNEHLRFVKQLSPKEVYKLQKEWFLAGASPETFRKQFVSESRAATSLRELIIVFDGVVADFKKTVSIHNNRKSAKPTPNPPRSNPTVTFVADKPQSSVSSSNAPPAASSKSQTLSSAPPAISSPKRSIKYSATI